VLVGPLGHGARRAGAAESGGQPGHYRGFVARRRRDAQRPFSTELLALIVGAGGGAYADPEPLRTTVAPMASGSGLAPSSAATSRSRSAGSALDRPAHRP